MSDSDKHLAGDYSGDVAGAYNALRFDRSARMRKLHAEEMSFAQSMMDMAGPQSVILDAPCGSGRFTEIFSHAKHLYSIDLSQDMLTEAERQAPPGHSGEFIRASALDIPLPDDSVDLAFCMRLFHHIGQEEVRSQLFSELARVSRRWVAVSFYRTGSYSYYRKRLMGRRLSGQPLKTDEFVNEAAGHGLRLRSVSPTGVSAFFVRSAQTLALFELEADASERSPG